MSEASFSGFIQTILIIILVFWGLRILLRILAPYMMRFFINKVSERMQKEFERTQNAYGQNRSEEKEGKQTIINKNSHSKNPEATKQVGEYIDYEEV